MNDSIWSVDFNEDDFSFEEKSDINNNDNIIKVESVKPELTYSETQLFSKMDNGEVLIEYLFENNLITANHIRSIYNHKEILDLCLKYNHKDLLKEISVGIILTHIDVFEEIIKLDIISDYLKNYADGYSLDQIKILLKYKKYNLLNKLPSSNLLYKVDGDKTLLETLIDLNIDNIKVGSFADKEVFRILFKKNRFDLLTGSDECLACLLENIDLNNTYLDKVLEQFVNDNSSFSIKNIIDLVNKTKKADLKVKSIEIFAKYNLLRYIKSLTKTDLYEGNEGERLIDKLSSLDEKIKSSIIDSNLFNDYRVILDLGLDAKLLKLNVSQEYVLNVVKERTTHQDIKIDEEHERLLMQLKVLLLGDEENNIDDIENTISSFRYIISLDPNAIEVLERLISIKQKENDKSAKLKYIFDQEKGSYFSSSEKLISINTEQKLPVVILHETGHAMHYYFDESKTPDGYMDLVNEVRNNPDFIKKVFEFCLEYLEAKKSIIPEVEMYLKKYDETITPKRKEEIEAFLSKEKSELIDYWVKKGRSKEYIEKVVSQTITKEKYIEQERDMIKRKITTLLTEEKFGHLVQILDTIDSIFEGSLHDNQIIYDKKRLVGLSGHGISYYYKNPSSMFKENIANYTALKYMPNSQQHLDKLRSIVGDKFVDFVESYYNQHLLDPSRSSDKAKSK